MCSDERTNLKLLRKCVYECGGACTYNYYSRSKKDFINFKFLPGSKEHTYLGACMRARDVEAVEPTYINVERITQIRFD